jgi:hypothetical protein
MDDTKKILEERGSRYGNYLAQANIACALRHVVTLALRDRGKTMAADQMDALVMINCKISRIVNGDPDYADNWRDIAGYATLVADRLEGK